MLSTKSLGTADSGIASYYEHLSQDDYYQAGSEPPGQWHGALSGALGLHGDVRPGQLRRLFEGYDPVSGRALASNAGENHKAGWDLTFSAPKSVSLAWAFSDLEMQREIAAAHDSAVRAGLDYLQRNAFSSRDRDGTQPLQGIIAACYQHSTSREQDPQLHTHAAVANVGLRTDGTPCAIDFDSRWKLAVGAVYRTELAHQLQKLDLDIERDGKSFRLASIPEPLCKTFSKRRSQIEEHLQKTGFTSAKAADIAALATRRAKENAERDILRSNWLREANEAGYSLSDIQAFLEPGQQRLAPGPATNKLDIPAIITGLTANEATFSRQQLEAAIAVEAQGFASALEIPILVQRILDEGISSNEPHGLIQLEEAGHEHDSRRRTITFTTREMLAMELSAIAGAVARKQERQHAAPVPKHLLEGLSTEQATAVRHITMDSGAVKSVRGLAGTGKSFMLSRAREAWEQAGLNVIGAALAGKAADGLQKGSGIASQTLHSLLADIDGGRMILNEKTVVVLDEAGMIGTRQLHSLLEHIHQAGAKAVLVGDPQQLQPIEAGGLFRRISEETGYACLEDIRRQESTEDRTMIKKLIGGQAIEVIERLSDAGQLRVERDDHIAEAMVKDWMENRDPQRPGESLMLAGTRADVRRLNQIARATLKSTSRLHSEITIDTEHGEREFAIGERVLFTRNSRALDVRNGMLGTLEGWRLDARSGGIEMMVRLDDGDVVRFDSTQYGHLDHGYAISTHKAQGVTCDNISVLLSESMTDREWSYVALSRHRKRLLVFAPSGMEEDLDHVLGRSRQKELASDYAAVPVNKCERELELELG
jgi:conjugative relaxase-like TrwC/TraI family protein